MTKKTKDELQAIFVTGAKPTQQNFADLIESSLNVSEVAAAADDDLISDPVTDETDPADFRIPMIGAGGSVKPVKSSIVLPWLSRYNRVWSLADWTASYPKNIPLLDSNSGDTEDIRPDQEDYDADIYDSAPALNAAITELSASYIMTGFGLMIPVGFWALNSNPNSTPVFSGTLASAPTSTTAVLPSGADANNDFYVGRTLKITGGTGSGQTREVIDYKGSTKTITVGAAWTTTPDDSSTFDLLPGFIIPMAPRMTIFGQTGNWKNCQLVRGIGVNGHMFGAIQTAGMESNGNEIRDITFRGVGLNGNWDVSGDTFDDIIHLFKPITGAWGDMRLKVRDCGIGFAKRRGIYYSARGDSEIRNNRFDHCGDDGLYMEGSTDCHVTDNIFASIGRHAAEFVNTHNVEFSSNNMYFTGQNQKNLWDSSTADNVRREGAVLMLNNCDTIRGVSNRFEDSTGTGIWFSSPGSIHLTGCLFNNLGTIGSDAQKAAGTKDYGTSGGITVSVVDGVDCVYFDGVGNGANLGNTSYIEGFARQARTNQQLRYIVNMDAPHSTFKPMTDITINIKPGSLDTGSPPRNPDDTAAWTALGKTSYWVAPGRLGQATQNYPVAFKRCKIMWKGQLIPAFHARTPNLRREDLNIFERVVKYTPDKAAVSANSASAVWASGTNANKDYLVTYALDADLTATLTRKHAVEIDGFADDIFNGVFNIDSIDGSSVTVHNPNVTDDSTDVASGATGTITGPVPMLVLDEAESDATYRVRTGTMNGSALPLQIISTDGNIDTTIDASDTEKLFRKDIYDGWAELV